MSFDRWDLKNKSSSNLIMNLNRFLILNTRIAVYVQDNDNIMIDNINSNDITFFFVPEK